MANLSIALTESRSLRNEQLSEVTDSIALTHLSKAKALVMAVWESRNVATTSQIATFYEVSEEVVRDNIRRHKDEFELDGLRIAKGMVLRELREIISLSPNSANETIWTPRAALRLGLLLRDSDVAKQVRNVVLDLVETVIPQQSDRIRELELEHSLLALKSSLVTMHGKEVGLMLLGLGDRIVETEKPMLEVIDRQSNKHFQGQTCKQVAEYVQKRTGKVFKSGAEVERFLRSQGRDDLIEYVQRPMAQACIPRHCLDEAYQLLQTGDRQLLIGE